MHSCYISDEIIDLIDFYRTNLYRKVEKKIQIFKYNVLNNIGVQNV